MGLTFAHNIFAVFDVASHRHFMKTEDSNDLFIERSQTNQMVEADDEIENNKQLRFLAIQLRINRDEHPWLTK